MSEPFFPNILKTDDLNAIIAPYQVPPDAKADIDFIMYISETMLEIECIGITEGVSEEMEKIILRFSEDMHTHWNKIAEDRNIKPVTGDVGDKKNIRKYIFDILTKNVKFTEEEIREFSNENNKKL